VEIARAEDYCQHEKETNAGMNCNADNPVQQSLAKSAGEGEDIADKVELSKLL
jgi:hypothetical protein